jgi:hypothetical protein
MTEHPSFTEVAYAWILDAAREKYRFNGSDLGGSGPVACWRHDIDYSPQRALVLARMEAARELRCVYHIAPSGRYYNVLEPETAEILREISALGHEVGLHFDMDVFPAGIVDDTAFLGRVQLEKSIIECVTGQTPTSFSFHNHAMHEQRLSASIEIGGMLNLASPEFYQGIRYLSDSNGIWRTETLETLMSQTPVPKLQVLTHPVWWTPEAMTPYQRFLRTVDGRRHANVSFYRDIMERDGRFESIRNQIGMGAS